jgi:hypothetical protein
VLIGLVSDVVEAALKIDSGRKGFAIEGKEREGRILYEAGIAQALSTFNEAQNSADPYIIILAEYTFVTQELELCSKDDNDSISSLSQAIQSFDDAFLVLKLVDDNASYQIIDKAFPHHKNYRVKIFPKDSYHIACISHRTRIKNILRFSGIDPIEKALLKQRFANLATAQNSYVEKQRKAIG